MPNEMLNTQEAAKVLRMSPGTLEVWRCNGDGPRYVKVGRLVFYRPEDIEEYTSSRIVETKDSFSRRRDDE